jgi:hypothetical protein
MQRPGYNTVTTLAIIVPCDPKDQEGVATFLQEFSKPQPVREVTELQLMGKGGSKSGILPAARIPEGQQALAIVALAPFVKEDDSAKVSKAKEYLRRAFALTREEDKRSGVIPAEQDDYEFGRAICPLFGLEPSMWKEALERWSGYKLGPNADRDPKWLFSLLLSNALSDARLVLWSSPSGLRPGLYCPDMETAYFAFFLTKIFLGDGGWGVCPKCGKVFVRKRSDQNYCTIAHREAHRVARWRAKQQVQAIKKGRRRNVTRKTR